jgi:hypothetical protein
MRQLDRAILFEKGARIEKIDYERSPRLLGHAVTAPTRTNHADN